MTSFYNNFDRIIINTLNIRFIIMNSFSHRTFSSSKSNGTSYYSGSRSGSSRRLKYLSGANGHAQDPIARRNKREMLNGMYYCYWE